MHQACTVGIGGEEKEEKEEEEEEKEEERKGWTNLCATASGFRWKPSGGTCAARMVASQTEQLESRLKKIRPSYTAVKHTP